jgi:hypothetical protein
VTSGVRVCTVFALSFATAISVLAQTAAPTTSASGVAIKKAPKARVTAGPGGSAGTPAPTK